MSELLRIIEHSTLVYYCQNRIVKLDGQCLECAIYNFFGGKPNVDLGEQFLVIMSPSINTIKDLQIIVMGAAIPNLYSYHAIENANWEC